MASPRPCHRKEIHRSQSPIHRHSPLAGRLGTRSHTNQVEHNTATSSRPSRQRVKVRAKDQIAHQNPKKFWINDLLSL